jgi:hypothetical protein
MKGERSWVLFALFPCQSNRKPERIRCFPPQRLLISGALSSTPGGFLETVFKPCGRLAGIENSSHEFNHAGQPKRFTNKSCISRNS